MRSRLLVVRTSPSVRQWNSSLASMDQESWRLVKSTTLVEGGGCMASWVGQARSPLVVVGWAERAHRSIGRLLEIAVCRAPLYFYFAARRNEVWDSRVLLALYKSRLLLRLQNLCFYVSTRTENLITRVPIGFAWSTGCLHRYLRRDNLLLHFTVV